MNLSFTRNWKLPEREYADTCLDAVNIKGLENF